MFLVIIKYYLFHIILYINYDLKFNLMFKIIFNYNLILVIFRFVYVPTYIL